MGGTFAVRFPVAGDPGDDGWHFDGSYAGDDGSWWTNHRSKGRALLMLVLLSDVGERDAPTRIRVGSHRYVRDLLLPYGEEGVNHQRLELSDEIDACDVALATGRAGDVYLCHPFLVHAAQRHGGTEPRFVAQPGVPWKEGSLVRAHGGAHDGSYPLAIQASDLSELTDRGAGPVRDSDHVVADLRLLRGPF